MLTPQCPECKSELGSIPIIKYNNRKRFGINYFCINMNCNYERDESNGTAMP
jgi:hypothetical protein